MKEPTEADNKIAEKILDAAFIVHKELGPGLLESVYEACLCDVLIEQGLKFERQSAIPISFRGKNLDAGFRADLIVEDRILVELKAVEKLIPLHQAQILTYLRLSKLNLGLLLNFNSKMLKDGIRRIVLS
jgi:GxxExxY protein